MDLFLLFPGDPERPNVTLPATLHKGHSIGPTGPNESPTGATARPKE